ncbi:MAG: 4Fe-4S binding protein [Psychromonas sp.]|nr:4Fe-4S binding protein [Alteromonadales bacterium]MCP5078301.1 4Fe-4S binding protein [Psychromonas sp.]
MTKPNSGKPFFLWKHLNKLRWLTLSVVFLMLILIPLLSIYQHYVAAHGYNHLSTSQTLLFDSMEFISAPFVDDAEHELDAIKGTTWSGQLFGVKLTDPLAVVNQISARLELYWPFILTALFPVLATIIFGRFFCGWICPATFLYELNSNVTYLLSKIGFKSANLHFSKNVKYFVLAIGIGLSAFSGTILFASIYPPAVLGRELYFSIALTGFSSGTLFFVLTLLFDSLVSKRGFCRYLCPGGALYSLLGRFRLFRVKRIVSQCNDCAKCNAVCEFGLNPMQDDFGGECNSCSACISVCPKDAMTFTIAITDGNNQGSGHLSRKYRTQAATQKSISIKNVD